MLWNISSLVFLFTFLPISLLIYYILPKKFKNAILLLTSLVFYAWGEPVYIFLMIGTIIFDYIMALKIDKYKIKLYGRLVIYQPYSIFLYGNI